MTQLEQSEVTGKAQLDSLREAAAVLERDLAGIDMPEESVDHYAARLAAGGRL